MTHWHILETEYHKEFAVRSILSGLGFTVWLPCEIRVLRRGKARVQTASKGLTITKEHPIIPGMLFAATGKAKEGVSMRVKGVGSLWTSTCRHDEIQAFQEAVENMNRLSFALSHRQTKEKRRIVKSLKELGEAMLEAAKRGLEEAA